MKRFSPFICILLACSCGCEDYTKYVNPLVGTDTWRSDVPVAGHEDPSGYTFPLVTEPFGMTEWTAHTMDSKERGTLHHRVPYWYGHRYISGFMGSHYPSGAVMFDYGAVELMPIVGKIVCRPEERSSSYSHDTETAAPDFYGVHLDDYDIDVRFSAAKSSAIMQFVFPESDCSAVVLDAMPSLFTADSPSEIRIDPENREITGKSGISARGYRQSGFFVVKFDKDIESFGTFSQNMDYPEVIEEEYLFTEKDGETVNGLTGTYTQVSDAFGKLQSTRVDPVIDFDWDWYKPADDFLFNDYDVVWTGKLKAPETGTYLVGLQCDDGARLYLDGRLVLDAWQPHGFSLSPDQCEIFLEEGSMHDIKVEYYQKEWSSKVKLSWVRPGKLSRSHLLEGNRELAASTKIGGYVAFRTGSGETVTARIGTSFISIEQARRNLEREIGQADFETVRKSLKRRWNEELGKIRLPASSHEQKSIFYTAMFHSMLVPRSLGEDGRYRSPYDGAIHDGETFTDYSLWDTFRAVHPLLTILKPEFSGRLVTGLLNGYKEGGWMPKWPNPGYTNCMLGTHSDAVIADAYAKGIRNFDADLAERAMMKNAFEKGNYIAWGRLGILDYIRLGYVPLEKYNESVARTMEFAYDDWCIAEFLEDKGGDAEMIRDFRERSLNFRNVLDSETKIVRGRFGDGRWADVNDYSISVWSGFNPKGAYNYRYNYTMFAPHAVDELISFVGGDESFSDYLDKLFEDDIYYVGDEFAMHAPYLYNYCGKPWKTQEQVRRIVEGYYFNSPAGLPGNDDCGQLSAWYLFGAMGFYPVCPGSTKYQITSPSVPETTISLDNGRKFTVRAKNLSPENLYIQAVRLNGKELHVTEIDHSDIVGGGVLEFELSDTPNPDWFYR